MPAPGSPAASDRMVTAARAVLQQVVVNPAGLNSPRCGWHDAASTLHSVATEAADLAGKQGLTPAALTERANQDKLRRIVRAVYSEYLHHGVKERDKVAACELRLLVERSIRRAVRPDNVREPIFRDLCETLLQMNQGDAKQAEAEIDDLVSELSAYWSSRIQRGEIRNPATLILHIQQKADSTVWDKIFYYRRRVHLSGEAPVRDEEGNEEDEIVWNLIADKSPDSNPEEAAVASDLRERWLAEFCGLVSDGVIQPLDAAILLLSAFGAPPLPEAGPNAEIAATLERWRAHSGGVAAYFQRQVGLTLEEAQRLAQLLEPELQRLPNPVTQDWVRHHRFRAKECLLREAPALLSRLSLDVNGRIVVPLEGVIALLARTSTSPDVIATLQQWRTSLKDITAYFQREVRLTEEKAMRLAQLLEPELQQLPNPVTTRWVNCHCCSKERLETVASDFKDWLGNVAREHLKCEGGIAT